MPNTVLELTGTLGTGLNATSNPDPNGLGTINPYPTPYTHSDEVSSAWTTQAKKALFPFGVSSGGGGQKDLKFHVVPSGGSSITYTLTIWFYNKVSNTWAKPATGASQSYTGPIVDYIETPGNDPIFLQISSLSSGTLSIYYDASLAEAA